MFAGSLRSGELSFCRLKLEPFLIFNRKDSGQPSKPRIVTGTHVGIELEDSDAENSQAEDTAAAFWLDFACHQLEVVPLQAEKPETGVKPDTCLKLKLVGCIKLWPFGFV